MSRPYDPAPVYDLTSPTVLYILLPRADNPLMSSLFRSFFQKSWVQVIALTVSLWALDLMQLSGDLSGASFQLVFAMLAPHIFSAAPVFASVFIYVLMAVISGACHWPIAAGEPLPMMAVRYCALLLAVTISLLFVNRSPTRRARALFVVYFLATTYIAATHVYAARLANPYLVIWPILLVLLPVLIFWRLRPFVPKFWQMAPAVVVYIPLRFIGYCLVTTCPPSAIAGRAISKWERLFEPTLLFDGLVLPLGPYVLMAMIAAVVLTYLGGWGLRRPDTNGGRIVVSEVDEQSGEHDTA